MAVLLSGAMAGLAGAYFTLGSVGHFDEVMTSGKGFIGLAAMIFGNYTPIGGFLPVVIWVCKYPGFKFGNPWQPNFAIFDGNATLHRHNDCTGRVCRESARSRCRRHTLRERVNKDNFHNILSTLFYV